MPTGIKGSTKKFPIEAIKVVGYSAAWIGQKSWNGVAILSRYEDIQSFKSGLPGFPEDENSRYVEAVINDAVIACLYLPNGNPAPGLKFDYKSEWIKHFTAHAKKLLMQDIPVVLAGDFSAIPTELDAYKPERCVEDAFLDQKLKKIFKFYDALTSDGLMYKSLAIFLLSQGSFRIEIILRRINILCGLMPLCCFMRERHNLNLQIAYCKFLTNSSSFEHQFLNSLQTALIFRAIPIRATKIPSITHDWWFFYAIGRNMGRIGLVSSDSQWSKMKNSSFRFGIELSQKTLDNEFK